ARAAIATANAAQVVIRAAVADAHAVVPLAARAAVAAAHTTAVDGVTTVADTHAVVPPTAIGHRGARADRGSGQRERQCSDAEQEPSREPHDIASRSCSALKSRTARIHITHITIESLCITSPAFRLKNEPVSCVSHAHRAPGALIRSRSELVAAAALAAT